CWAGRCAWWPWRLLTMQRAERTGNSSDTASARSSRRPFVTATGGCAGRVRVVVCPPLLCPSRPAAAARRAAPFSHSRLFRERSMDAWPRCLERLEAELPAEDVHTWLKPLQARRQDSRTVLYAPNAFVRDEVESRYLQRIRELLAHFAGSGDVQLEIGSLPRAAAPPATDAATGAAAPAKPAPMVSFAGHLDSHYTFENFVEGRSNQMGRAAAWQAALKPGDRSHNPLLLYGGTGLGKTHLMFAAGNAMRQANPSARVLYLRSEEFYSAFFRSIQERTSDQFKRQFRQIDALLIDDIQFFAGKDRTQEEFFHTFNTLF